MPRDAPGGESMTHVVGAGLAGLSAAMTLVEAGRRVTVHESGPQAGGRCRSYFDRELGCRLDNGNHLLLSGNREAWAFMDRIGSRDTMGGPNSAAFPFIDVATGERWTVRPNAGRLPWWVLSRSRRVPGARLREFAAMLALRRASPTATVAEMLPAGELSRRLLEPLAISALNTPLATGSARLLGRIMDESLSRGGRACVPAYPREGLSETFIDPAVEWLRRRGATVHIAQRIAALSLHEDRVEALGGPAGMIAVGPEDSVVLAVPAPAAAAMVPDLVVPNEFEAIVNLHYRIDSDPGEAGFVGLVGGTAEWVFLKPGVVSVTISAANRLVDRTAEDLATSLWPEVSLAAGLDAPLPKWRVVKEKRATFAATPAQDARRPGAATAWRNLALAGDWTATGLPATIEGAIRSGRTAAHHLLAG